MQHENVTDGAGETVLIILGLETDGRISISLVKNASAYTCIPYSLPSPRISVMAGDINNALCFAAEIVWSGLRAKNGLRKFCLYTPINAYKCQEIHMSWNHVG